MPIYFSLEPNEVLYYDTLESLDNPVYVDTTHGMVIGRYMSIFILFNTTAFHSRHYRCYSKNYSDISLWGRKLFVLVERKSFNYLRICPVFKRQNMLNVFPPSCQLRCIECHWHWTGEKCFHLSGVEKQHIIVMAICL